MSYPTYEITQIHEAISKPKGDRAHAVANVGWGIDPLLDYCKNSLSEDAFLNAEDIIEKLREYVKRNYDKKFQTMGYARKLVSDLESILKPLQGYPT